MTGIRWLEAIPCVIAWDIRILVLKRKVLASLNAQWALSVLCGIVFPEVVALKTDDVSDQ